MANKQFDPQKWKPLFLAVVAMFLVYILRIVMISPTGFPKYLLTVVITVAAIIVFARLVHRLVGIKCPQCRLPLYHTEDRGIFSGTIGTREEWFSPIGIHVLTCKRCGKEFHKMFNPPERAAANAGRYLVYDTKYIAAMLSGGSDIFKDFDFEDKKVTGSMTPQQYDMLKRQIAQEVDSHNRRQGFLA